MNLTSVQRSLLNRFADLIIPADDGFPSGGAVDVAGSLLDELLVARPDLLPALQTILQSTDDDDPVVALGRLRAHRADAFDQLAEVVAGAYFLHPAVREGLKYQGQIPRPVDSHPDYLENGLLQSVMDRGRIYRPTWPRYDWRKTYDWNFINAPKSGRASECAIPGRWDFCSRPVGSPLGIAAGPLLNGAWILYYASLGFDVLTYKTVRSSPRGAYLMPNLQPVIAPPLHDSEQVIRAQRTMHQSWAVSFGMPSQPADFWRRDIEQTRADLARDKILSVSVVATPQDGWGLADVIADFAQCARWAIESGADAVEANFSCPNVASMDGQLYQQPEAAAQVAASLRQAVGRRPLLIKIGHVTGVAAAEALLRALAPHVDALVMVNCIAATVRGEAFLFNGEKRGIAGEAIRQAALNQVRLFAGLIQRHRLPTKLVGVGGIATAADVEAQLQAGSHAVQIATAAMLDPGIGLRIRSDWKSRLTPT